MRIIIRIKNLDLGKKSVKEKNVFEFEFYSSPIHRAKELFLAYKGNLITMGRDGWMEVYGYCKVPKELENEWFDVI